MLLLNLTLTILGTALLVNVGLRAFAWLVDHWFASAEPEREVDPLGPEPFVDATETPREER